MECHHIAKPFSVGRNCIWHFNFHRILHIIPIIGTFMKRNSMARNTSILLGEHFEDFISAKISSGKYNSASEVIRTALRLLEA